MSPVRHVHVRRTAPSFISRLLLSPHLARVKSIDLAHCRIGPGGAEALASCRHLRQLESLGLCHAHIGPAGIRALSASHYLTELKSLDLSDNDLEGDATTRSAISEWLGQLQSLNLSVNRLGTAAQRTIAGTRPMAKLTRLVLRGNAIGDDGVCELARSRHLTTLTQLDLADNGITSHGVRTLLESEVAHGLQVLDLAFNEIGNEGGMALASAPNLESLRSLILDGSQVAQLNTECLELLEQRWGKRVSLNMPWGIVFQFRRSLNEEISAALKPRYLAVWANILSVFLNWPQDRIHRWTRRWEDGLNYETPESGGTFYHETADYYVVPLLIPDALRSRLTGIEQVHLEGRIGRAITFGNSRFEFEDHHDSRTAKERVEAILAEYDQE